MDDLIAELLRDIKALRERGQNDEADNLCQLANEMGLGY